jgi:hypothetical protein
MSCDLLRTHCERTHSSLFVMVRVNVLSQIREFTQASRSASLPAHPPRVEQG